MVVSLVYPDGRICLDILQEKWNPGYDTCSVLTSIQVNSKIVFV